MTRLELKVTESKARDTFGQTRVTLTDRTTGKRYVTVGGGYDMSGTVFGEWLASAHGAAIAAVASRAYYSWTDGSGNGVQVNDAPDALDGLMRYEYADGTTRRIAVDGAVGMSSMETLARAIGLRVKSVRSTAQGMPTAWTVEPAGE